jgi:hypothetical protein
VPCQKLTGQMSGVVFLVSLGVPLISPSVLWPTPLCLDNLSFKVNLKIKLCESPTTS